MYTYASQKNRIVESPLECTYEIEEVVYNEGLSKWYRVTRRATKKYSYVDMSEQTALAVAAEKVALYTRAYFVDLRRRESETHPQSIGIVSCTSEIAVTNAAGPCYSVEINVFERDVRAAATRPTDPAALFTVENARDYDDGVVSLEIASAEYDPSTLQTTIRFSAESVPTRGIVAQSLVDGEWVTANLEQRGTSAVVTTASAIAEGATVRLVCGPVESAPFDMPEPTLYRVTFAAPGATPPSYPDQFYRPGEIFHSPGSPVGWHADFVGWFDVELNEYRDGFTEVTHDVDLGAQFAPWPE